jgi:hypothetical protein
MADAPFFVTHRYGEQGPLDVSAFPSLIAELNDRLDDKEHGLVSVEHESGWNLSLSLGRSLIWENVEDPDVQPRHMHSVPAELTLRLWWLLATGQFEAISAEPWINGYPQ